MANPNAIQAALRRQIEAVERFDEESDQKLAAAGVRPPTPAEKARLREAMGDFIAKSERRILAIQLEGFVAGWLAATGQLDQYGELLQIWLDTPKRIEDAEPADVSDTLLRIARRGGPEQIGAPS